MITVVSVSKSGYTAATARTYLVTDSEHTYDEIVDAGLKAMRENRSSLFGYGIEGDSFLRSSNHRLPAGHYTVYAYRD